MTEQYAEIVRLREEVADLKAEIARRDEEANSAVASVMIRTGLTKTLARILVALSTGGFYSRDRLLVLCGYDEDAYERNIDSQIKRFRKRVKGIRVKTLYGLGYCIHEADLPKARQIVGGAMQ